MSARWRTRKRPPSVLNRNHFSTSAERRGWPIENYLENCDGVKNYAIYAESGRPTALEVDLSRRTIFNKARTCERVYLSRVYVTTAVTTTAANANDGGGGGHEVWNPGDLVILI